MWNFVVVLDEAWNYTYSLVTEQWTIYLHYLTSECCPELDIFNMKDVKEDKIKNNKNCTWLYVLMPMVMFKLRTGKLHNIVSPNSRSCMDKMDSFIG